MKRNSIECTELESYTPWPNDETCKKFEVRRSPEGTFSKPVALASGGCSGSSFLAQLIERTSGFVVGAVVPTVPNEYVFTQSHCNLHIWDGKSILIESRDTLYHQLPNWYKKTMAYEGEEVSWPVLSKIFFQYKGILIVRNPWNVIISSRMATQEIMRFCSCTKTKYKSELDFEINGFTKFFRKGVSLWVNHLKSWIRGSPDGKDMVIIQYEKLVENPGPEIRRALKYLNVTVNEDRLHCTLKNPPNLYNPFIKSKNNLKSIMTKISKIFDENQEANSILENGIMEINILLKKKGLRDRLDYKRPDLSDLLVQG